MIITRLTGINYFKAKLFTFRVYFFLQYTLSIIALLLTWTRNPDKITVYQLYILLGSSDVSFKQIKKVFMSFLFFIYLYSFINHDIFFALYKIFYFTLSKTINKFFLFWLCCCFIYNLMLYLKNAIHNRFQFIVFLNYYT
jgi:hypothetical protein